MDTFPNFLASAFVIVIAVFIGMSLIISGVSITSAQSFHSNVADAIGAADAEHEDIIIEECKALAEESGYTLAVEKINIDEDDYYFELDLEYKFAAPFFGQISTGTVSGYVYRGTHVRLT